MSDERCSYYTCRNCGATITAKEEYCTACLKLPHLKVDPMSDIDKKIEEWEYILKYGPVMPMSVRESFEECIDQLKVARERSENLDAELKHWIDKYKQDLIKIEHRTKEVCKKAWRKGFSEWVVGDLTDCIDKAIDNCKVGELK